MYFYINQEHEREIKEALAEGGYFKSSELLHVVFKWLLMKSFKTFAKASL